MAGLYQPELRINPMNLLGIMPAKEGIKECKNQNVNCKIIEIIPKGFIDFLFLIFDI
jgi:hypothetical protein